METTLACMVCLDLCFKTRCVGGRILQCENGHVICEPCFDALPDGKKECGLCRASMPKKIHALLIKVSKK